ncbi:hypothetical protein [Mailhella sp.]
MILTWSNTPPAKPGWYWCKELDGKKRVVHLTENEGVLGFWVSTTRGTSGFTVHELVTRHCWNFAGPLEEPQEEE